MARLLVPATSSPYCTHLVGGDPKHDLAGSRQTTMVSRPVAAMLPCSSCCSVAENDSSRQRRRGRAYHVEKSSRLDFRWPMNARDLWHHKSSDMGSREAGFLSLRRSHSTPDKTLSASPVCSTWRHGLRQTSFPWVPVPSAFPSSSSVIHSSDLRRTPFLGCALSPSGSSCNQLHRSRGPGCAWASAGPNEPHAANLKWPEVRQQESLELLEGNGVTELEAKDLLQSKLPSHPKLHRGQLSNGMRYVILPNSVPPNRFEAHMEMHVGSVDEKEHEQGIAHMIEHVAFLGSKKRERLLGTGARSNAYTDFHHTVFHVHSPVTMQGTNELLMPLVLDALHEIAFKPKVLSTRVEKERRAVLSELQMMNSIEYRVDCQLLQQLHSENLLGYRFPIGLEELIQKWDLETIRAFHERWYFPANATLFIVGDIGSVGRTLQMVEARFGSTPPGFDPPANPAKVAGPVGHLQTIRQPFFGSSFIEDLTMASESPPAAPVRKERHIVRPPVKHQWSVALPSGSLKKPHVFQHELLQNFSLSMFCKTPVQKVNNYGDLRDALMRRIVLSTLQFRINSRYKSANPPFNSIDMDHSDSSREGCTVTTLNMTAEPRHWKGAVKVGVQEVKRLKKFGVTRGELTRYLNALLKDSEHLAAMLDNVPSLDNLDFVMESDALGHTVMDQQQGHEALMAVAETVTLEDVNATASRMLAYVADFGAVTAPVPAAIVACVPRTLHADGVGDISFQITSEDIVASILEGLNEPLFPEPEVDVPKELVSPLQLAALRIRRSPTFIPLEGRDNLHKYVDDVTGVVQRRLSNGIRVNYKISKNEAKGGVMRLVVAGGRARESSDYPGSVAVGVRTLSEGGAVGGFSREQVELFCVGNLINCVLEADEEFLCMDFHFTLRDGGMRAAFQLLHMVLEQTVFVEDALDRAKQLYLSHFRAMPKSLERATANRLMRAMLDYDETRFTEPSVEALQKLTLDVARTAVMRQLVTPNMEVSVVGDFSEDEVEACLLDYLGTVAPEADPQGRLEAEAAERPVLINLYPSPELRHQKIFLRDTDERACAYIAGPAPNRWGFTMDGRDLNTLMEPVPSTMTEEQAWDLASDGVDVVRDSSGTLCWKRQRNFLYGSVALALLSEVINARLFTTVRDALGLTYDVSFELSMFDRLKAGWFVISVTSTPAKIHQAVEASLNVLRGIPGNRINQRELDRAKRTLMMRHESDCKDNTYWLGLLTHIQAPSVPRKHVGCIRDITYLYEMATADDVYTAYNHLSVDEDSIYSCVGVAGTEAGTGAEVLEVDEEIEGAGAASGALQAPTMHGRGMSTVTRPTT